MKYNRRCIVFVSYVPFVPQLNIIHPIAFLSDQGGVAKSDKMQSNGLHCLSYKNCFL